MKSFEFGASLGWVWREFGESPNSLQSRVPFPNKHEKSIKGKHNITWNHLSLDRVWSEFGESLENLQTHSKLIPLFPPKKMKFKKIKIYELGASLGRVWRISKRTPNSFLFSKETMKKQKTMKTYEFGASLENLQTHSKLTKKSLLDVIFPKKQKMKNEFGESPKSFQTQKNMRAQFFFEWLHAYFVLKKSCARIFLLSLERVWRFSKLIFFLSFQKKNFLKKHQAKISLWVWSEFGVSLERVWRISKLTPNSQRNLCLMTFFKNDFFKKKRKKNKFGESPNSKKICVHNFFWVGARFFLKNKLCTHIFLSLERVRRFSKLIFSFFLKNPIFFEKWHQAKISLWTWSEFGDSPNSLLSLERVWREFEEPPNLLQTHSSLSKKCLR